MTEHEFCLWVAKWIFEWQNEYNELDGAFCEVACRKLNKLGIVTKNDDEWHFEDEDHNSITMIDAVKKGTWRDKKVTIKKAHGIAYGRWGCSVCKVKQPHKSNFCPNCGADMREVQRF